MNIGGKWTQVSSLRRIVIRHVGGWVDGTMDDLMHFCTCAATALRVPVRTVGDDHAESTAVTVDATERHATAIAANVHDRTVHASIGDRDSGACMLPF